MFLKRVVGIQVVVTEKFKEYVKYECTETLTQLNKKLAQLKKERKEKVSKKKPVEDITRDIGQIEKSIMEVETRKTQTADMEIGKLFNQGTIEGFTSVSEGDNLYAKLGGNEMIIEDGIIKKILPAKTMSDR